MPESHVCFVVTELLGLVRNGGIATATTHAALVLREQGYDVDLFYCGLQTHMEEDWDARYRRAGITVQWLDRDQMVHPPFIADSYRLLKRLRTLDYDVIVFQDWQGLGYCSMVAKAEGLAFASTRLLHICHGPDEWLREANRQLEVDGMELGSAHMERRSAELADAIVGPSQHLIDWMLGAGWQLPEARHVIPYFTEGHTTDLAFTPPPRENAARLSELVFFGRLEERKGVRVFVDALNALGGDVLRGLSVTFLGREATVTRDEIRELIAPDVHRQLASFGFVGDLDQAGARRYLQQPGRLAIIPSYLDNSPNVVYECIEDRVSFIASRAGGTGELVHDDDKEATLFDPTARSLAEKLRPLVTDRMKPPPPRPSFDGLRSLDLWRPLLAPSTAAPFKLDESPLVSVIVPHFNQPDLIWPTLESIAAQDYPNLEIVVVDDGSTDARAIANLDAIEHHEWKHPLSVVRQENMYLGAARNTGIRNSTGDYLAFVDDDDIVEPGYVRALLTALVRLDASAATMAIHALEEDDDGNIPDGTPNSLWVFFGDAVHLGTVINIFGGAAALYRRDALEELGGFFTHRDIGHEDWDLLARLNLHGHRVVSVPEEMYKYRVRRTSMLRTTSTWANMQPVLRSYEALLPESLRVWALLVRGQQEMIDDLRARVAPIEAENAALRARYAQSERYLAVLRRALPPRARAGIKSMLGRE